MGTHPIFESDFDCLTAMEISVTRLLRICAFFPSTAFILCLFLALWTDWDRSVDTICQRDHHNHHPVNFLPSISMLISSKQPMLFIWRSFIGLHLSPRLLLGLHFWQRHRQVLAPYNLDFKVRLMYIFYYCDIIGLIILTYVQSNEWFIAHAIGFGLFLVGSSIFMLLNLSLNARLNRPEIVTLKRICFANLASLVICMFCYYQHNTYCQDYVYTLFALFEYSVVYTNIAYHYKSGNIFGSSILIISSDQTYNLLPS